MLEFENVYCKMNPKSPEARKQDLNPFEGLKISDSEVLNDLHYRSACSYCGKSRMYFCYTCFVPVNQLEGKLPVCSVRIFYLILIIYFVFITLFLIFFAVAN